MIKKIDDKEYNNIIDMYQRGKTQPEIAALYNCSVSTISGLLRKIGVKTRIGGSVNTENVVEQWCQMYQNGMSLNDIAKLFNVRYTTVSKHLKNNGITIDRYTYHFDEHYFDNIDTQEKAYILGLLWADGCNFTNKNSVILGLQEQDYELLEQINLLTKNERPLRKQNLSKKNKKWKNFYKLVWQSQHLSNLLESYGMKNNKTLMLEFPNWMDNNLYSHFIRGYFDGDGCISLRNKDRSAVINMVGTRMFLDKVSSILKDNTGVDVYVQRDERASDPICVLRCGQRNDVIKILEWLYRDSKIYLQRKYNKYQQFLNNINNSCCA